MPGTLAPSGQPNWLFEWSAIARSTAQPTALCLPDPWRAPASQSVPARSASALEPARSIGHLRDEDLARAILAAQYCHDIAATVTDKVDPRAPVQVPDVTVGEDRLDKGSIRVRGNSHTLHGEGGVPGGIDDHLAQPGAA